MSRNEITLQEMFSSVIGELREGGRWGTGFTVGVLGEFRLNTHFQLRIAQAKFISETLGGSFPTSFPHYQRIAEKAVIVKLR